MSRGTNDNTIHDRFHRCSVIINVSRHILTAVTVILLKFHAANVFASILKPFYAESYLL